MAETINENEIPDWLNTEYLANILKLQDDSQIYEVLNFTVKSPKTKGENYSSLIYRITLNYKLKNNDTNKTQFFLLKTLPKGELMQKLMSESEIFVRENNILNKVIPLIEKLYHTKTNKKLSMGPMSVFSPIEHTVIMTDLSPEGYKIANRSIGLDFEHCRLALETLAKFHGITAILNDKMEGYFVRSYVENMYKESSEHILNPIYSNAFNDIGKCLKEWSTPPEYIEKYLKECDTLGTKLIKISKWTNEDFGCIIHGDFWVNNMLFKYSDNGKLEDMRLIDFQLSRWNNPAYDILFFFNSSIEDNVRFTQANELLEIYHNALNDTLKVLGSEIEYKYNDLINDLTKYGFYSMVIASTIMPVCKADKEDVPDLENLTEEAMLETNTVKNTYKSEGFKKTFPLLLEDAINRGFI